MSAVMWEVVRQRNIKHYGKLEEFVSMVTDAVPELMSKREGRLLSLGLRARSSALGWGNCIPCHTGADGGWRLGNFILFKNTPQMLLGLH